MTPSGHSFRLALVLYIVAAAVFAPWAFPLPASTDEPKARGCGRLGALALGLAASLIACSVRPRAL